MKTSQWKYPDKGELPPDNTYVLCEHSRGTWSDNDDNHGVNFVVLKFVRGISEQERAALKMEGDRRANVTFSADEHGNNLRPYCWKEFGPDCFFGQDIKRWMEIPK